MGRLRTRKGGNVVAVDQYGVVSSLTVAMVIPFKCPVPASGACTRSTPSLSRVHREHIACPQKLGITSVWEGRRR